MNIPFGTIYKLFWAQKSENVLINIEHVHLSKEIESASRFQNPTKYELFQHSEHVFTFWTLYRRKVALTRERKFSKRFYRSFTLYTQTTAIYLVFVSTSFFFISAFEQADSNFNKD